MRKGTMMVALVALLVAIFATAAYAATIKGTAQNDVIVNETAGDDQIYGFRGADFIEARQFAGDRDKLYGGRGNDELDADDNDPDDLVVGGRGRNDSCEGDVGDEFKSCDGNVFRNPIP